ncbi:hypothetical protein LCGC14_0411180 [marine sediment metagenome]|uniref:Uncharacterized protein n=1 Tax=marine sediment metagenome TaxID=412755 RepID=A0A0F9STW1_9ZZZZ
MSQVTYKSEKVSKKRVMFENNTGSSVTVRGGWQVVYDQNQGTATDVDGERATRVQINDGNAKNYAGALTEEHDGKIVADGGTRLMDIYVPTADGQKVPIWTDQNCTIDVTILTLQDNSHVAGGVIEGRPIARAMQTVDRSSTAGLVQALLQTNVEGAEVSVRSRATTELPTAAIWDNFDLSAAKDDEFSGSYLRTDFTHGAEGMPTHKYVSATYAATADGKTDTEQIYMGPGATGELRFITVTDHQKACAQWNVPITISGGNPWGFEVRIKQSLITNTLANYVVGLAISQITLEDALTDAGAPIDGGILGFALKEADGNAIGVIYDESGQTQNEHDAAFAVPAADTYNTFGLYHNGTTIAMYLDGVASGTAISAVDIAAADFPTAAIFFPSLWLSAANAADFTVTMDWIQVFQPAA